MKSLRAVEYSHQQSDELIKTLASISIEQSIKDSAYLRENVGFLARLVTVWLTRRP